MDRLAICGLAIHMTTTLVLGGTGKTGRRVAQRLASLGLKHRIGSRSGTPPFDWNDQSTWPAVLQRIDAVYIAYYPDLAFPGAAPAIHALSSLAVQQGVRRIVLLSGRNEEEAWPSEDAVRDSGAEWTILRASWLSQNFSEHFLLDPVLSGVIALPGGDTAEPFVDAEDVADVAVAALTSPGHAGKLYELTGPRALTFGEAAAEIATASGRAVRYIPITAAEYAAEASQYMPADEAAAMADLFAKVLDGRNSRPTSGVQDALGRPPADFAEYAKRAAASGIWPAA